MANLKEKASQPINGKQIFILFTTIIVIPLLWGLGIFKIPIEILLSHINRPHFWSFFSSVSILEWTAFLLIYWAIRKRFYESLSINESFVKKHYIKALTIILLLLIIAGLAPNYLYQNEIPGNSLILGDIGPVNSIERIFFVFLALTAGICEEIIFRGYGITMLEKLVKNKPLALVLSSLCFMALHGIAFLPWYLMLQYFMIGLLFGFIFQKYRRLELLIFSHFIIDAMIAVLVP